MKTKIIYCFVTTEGSDLYNQLLVSLYTLKLNNKDSFVEVVCDHSSMQFLDETILQFIDNVVECDIPDKFNTPKLKSRFIKTSLRNIVEGDYIFIDADTVIVGDLSALDNITDNITAVYSRHYPNVIDSEKVGICENWIRKFGIMHKLDLIGGVHFNSGIMVVKDNDVVRDFYNKWHENWLKYYSNSAHQDEPMLVITDMSFNHIIKPLNPIYNCQLPLENSEYFIHDAKIFHYIHNCMRPRFLNKDLGYIKENYENIKTWFVTYWIRNHRNKILKN